MVAADDSDWESPPRTARSGADESLLGILHDRHKGVTALTTKYYRGDIVPPSTRSQILRALKFSTFYYYAMNATFFAYAALIPLRLQAPYYGGLNVRDIRIESAHLVIVGLVLTTSMVRFLTLSWADQFYQYGFVLAGVEASICLFVALCWSSGLPMVLALMVCNMLNVSISQYYWRSRFDRAVCELETAVPPAVGNVRDNTVLSVWSSLDQLYLEFRKLWGLSKYRSPATLYNEQAGMFSEKEQQMSHVRAMFMAYMQALNPKANVAPWRREPALPTGIARLVDGLLNTLISNAFFSFAGLWLGQALFANGFRGEIAWAVATVAAVMYGASLRRNKRWLQEGLGAAVAEKEWLAFDIVKYQGDRADLMSDVLDQEEQFNVDLAQATQDNDGLQEFAVRGRENLTFMWLCVATVADFIGEGHLANTYWAVAAESRFMIEACTQYNFQLFAHAKWEIAISGVLLKITQTLLLACVCVLYCGTYYSAHPLPIPLMSAVGVACFLHSISKLLEATQFFFSVLGRGQTTHRHAYVAESIVLVAFIAALVNIVIWLYLLPMIKHWEFPIGKCVASYNKFLLPSACHQGQ